MRFIGTIVNHFLLQLLCVRDWEKEKVLKCECDDVVEALLSSCDFLFT